MRIVVVGLGSMGKRRIRLLQGFFDGMDVAGVDRDEARRAAAADAFGIPCYNRLEDAVAGFSPDAGFVSAAPLAHGEIIGAMLQSGLHVFSEINLTDALYDENIALAKARDRTLFLSATPMYRKEIEYVSGRVKALENPGKIRYRYHVGQYLSDWHPWENYKDFFVGDRRTNGCREIFAIELPWMLDAFGDLASLSVERTNLSTLDIDYPDCYTLTLAHKSGALGQLMVDIVARKAVRALEVVGEDIYLSWGGTPETLMDYDIGEKRDRMIACYDEVTRDSRYADYVVEDAYVSEMKNFFGVVAGTEQPRHSFMRDREILKRIDEIEGVDGEGAR